VDDSDRADGLRRRREEILDRIRQLKARGRQLAEHSRRGATPEETEEARRHAVRAHGGGEPG
jgi:uncharacterized coiled-coil DUF342 family protein